MLPQSRGWKGKGRTLDRSLASELLCRVFRVVPPMDMLRPTLMFENPVFMVAAFLKAGRVCSPALAVTCRTYMYIVVSVDLCALKVARVTKFRGAKPGSENVN
jgi:hypothetical protein